jgi:hypothetical protein
MFRIKPSEVAEQLFYNFGDEDPIVNVIKGIVKQWFCIICSNVSGAIERGSCKPSYKSGLFSWFKEKDPYFCICISFEDSVYLYCNNETGVNRNLPGRMDMIVRKIYKSLLEGKKEIDVYYNVENYEMEDPADYTKKKAYGWRWPHVLNFYEKDVIKRYMSGREEGWLPDFLREEEYLKYTRSNYEFS